MNRISRISRIRQICESRLGSPYKVVHDERMRWRKFNVAQTRFPHLQPLTIRQARGWFPNLDVQSRNCLAAEDGKKKDVRRHLPLFTWRCQYITRDAEDARLTVLLSRAPAWSLQLGHESTTPSRAGECRQVKCKKGPVAMGQKVGSRQGAPLRAEPLESLRLRGLSCPPEFFSRWPRPRP